MRKGFSLIELTVALGLAALFLLAASFIVNSYLKDFSKMSGKLQGLQVRNFISGQMMKDIRSADRIISSNPVRLGLKREKDTIYYDLFADKVRRTKNGYVSYLCETGDIRSLGFEYPRRGLILIKIDQDITGGFVRNEQ